MTVQESLRQINRIQNRLQRNYDLIQSAIRIPRIEVQLGYLDEVARIKNIFDNATKLNRIADQFASEFSASTANLQIDKILEWNNSIELIKERFQMTSKIETLYLQQYSDVFSELDISKIHDISSIVDEIPDDLDLPNEFYDFKELVREDNRVLSKSPSAFVVITLVASLVTIIAFFLDFFPDKNQERLLESLETLVEIQSNQMELLSELGILDNESDDVDESNLVQLHESIHQKY